MNSQRQGTNLKIDIRIALHSLGRDHKVSLTRKSLSDLRDMLAGLRKEQVAAGIIKQSTAA